MNWLSDTVYWSDAVLRHIMVSQFDGRYHSILLEDAGQPRGIAVDAVHGSVYENHGPGGLLVQIVIIVGLESLDCLSCRPDFKRTIITVNKGRLVVCRNCRAKNMV